MNFVNHFIAKRPESSNHLEISRSQFQQSPLNTFRFIRKTFSSVLTTFPGRSLNWITIPDWHHLWLLSFVSPFSFITYLTRYHILLYILLKTFPEYTWKKLGKVKNKWRPSVYENPTICLVHLVVIPRKSKAYNHTRYDCFWNKILLYFVNGRTFKKLIFSQWVPTICQSKVTGQYFNLSTLSIYDGSKTPQLAQSMRNSAKYKHQPKKETLAFQGNLLDNKNRVTKLKLRGRKENVGTVCCAATEVVVVVQCLRL